VNLNKLFLNYVYHDYGRNKFQGQVPEAILDFTKLERMWLNVATMVGPIPDLTVLTLLQDCSFLPGGYCREWDVPNTGKCDLTLIPTCKPDCLVMYAMFEGIHAGTCCDHPGIFCNDDYRIREM
jgi:hypothetical protein